MEGWQKYLIIHSCFGENVNRTLAYTFEEVLSRKGLIRLWYLDGYRIMMELTVDVADIDLKGLGSAALRHGTGGVREDLRRRRPEELPLPRTGSRPSPRGSGR